MVYSFAEQSGGHVTVYSEAGKGTTVNLYLPQTGETVAAAAPAPEAKEGLPRGRGETILVVEDDTDIRELAMIQLESLGYRVRVAPDGKSALASLGESSDIDLLLTDVVLPGGLDGRNLAKEVEQRFGRIKVLFMSGYTEHAVHFNDWVDQDADLLQKPFRRQELAKKVRAALDRSPD
jgi:CheY-like chemotaxis protein